VTKRFTIAILLTLILIVSLAYLFLQKTSNENLNSVDSFNLVLRYGVGAKNELNTFNGTFTKDLILDPSVTTNLALTNEEKLQIQHKIAEIDFFNLPDSFPTNQSVIVIPMSAYYIRVQNGTQIKEVSWNTNSVIDNETSINLEQLVSFIVGIIEEKPEYKALPPARGGYI
jgi:hypothetical protein